MQVQCAVVDRLQVVKPGLPRAGGGAVGAGHEDGAESSALRSVLPYYGQQGMDLALLLPLPL